MPLAAVDPIYHEDFGFFALFLRKNIVNISLNRRNLCMCGACAYSDIVDRNQGHIILCMTVLLS